MKKNSVKILSLAASAVALLAVIFVSVKLCTLPYNSSDSTGKTVRVPAGASVRATGNSLKSEHLIRSELLFYFAARYPAARKILMGSSETFMLKSGVYRISPSMNLNEILKVLSSGNQEYIRVTVPEGLTVSKIGMIMEEAGVCSAADFKEASKNPELLEKLNVRAESFEGFLFPDTYFLTPLMQASSVIETMVENFFEKFRQVTNAENIPESKILDTVILASIIEREYRIASEAPLISSVFNNRLKHNIGLYSCATLEYIITEIEGREHPDVITYKDIEIDSPYNTYKWAGLPPGPISNPGLVALNAAVNPALTNYFYFRLVDPEKGNHVFSKTFSNHIENAHSYNTKKSGY